MTNIVTVFAMLYVSTKFIEMQNIVLLLELSLDVDVLNNDHNNDNAGRTILYHFI